MSAAVGLRQLLAGIPHDGSAVFLYALLSLPVPARTEAETTR